jgi:hypothetical protein
MQTTDAAMLYQWRIITHSRFDYLFISLFLSNRVVADGMNPRMSECPNTSGMLKLLVLRRINRVVSEVGFCYNLLFS